MALSSLEEASIKSPTLLCQNAMISASPFIALQGMQGTLLSKSTLTSHASQDYPRCLSPLTRTRQNWVLPIKVPEYQRQDGQAGRQGHAEADPSQPFGHPPAAGFRQRPSTHQVCKPENGSPVPSDIGPNPAAYPRLFHPIKFSRHEQVDDELAELANDGRTSPWSSATGLET
jgi:hypothetical protein